MLTPKFFTSLTIEIFSVVFVFLAIVLELAYYASKQWGSEFTMRFDYESVCAIGHRLLTYSFKKRYNGVYFLFI